MAAPEPLPRYVYKIHVPGSSSLRELSDLDRQSGFIHLSTAQQVPLAADRFFAQHTRLRLQKIPVESIATKLKWEESDGAVFPHLYSDPLVGAIADDVEVLQWSRDGGQTWIQSAKHLTGLE